MDLPLVMAALMNRYGEDILPEEVAYAMEDKATSSTGNAAFAAAAAQPLRLPLLAGLDGSGRPARPDPR